MSTTKKRTPKNRSVSEHPQMWSRRMARLIGRKFGVKMTSHLSQTDGMHERTPIVIKCAKSYRAPIALSQKTLERVSVVWGVFLDEKDNAEIYTMSARDFRKNASFYSPRNGSPHYVIRYKRFKANSEHLKTLPNRDIDAIEIP